MRPNDQPRWLESPWEAAAGTALVLLVGSLLPSPFRRRPAFSTVGPDKLLHFVGHAVFAAVLADALATDRFDDPESVVLAVCLSTGYGVAIGRLQEWVPGRAPERADLIAGMLGSAAGAAGWQQLTAGFDGEDGTARSA
jgi:VanZ family protein